MTPESDMPVPIDRVPIARVSALLDVPVPTLRSWERRYGTVDPLRTPGGHRRYSAEDVARLRAMRDEIVRGVPPRDAARHLHRPLFADGGSAERSRAAMLDAALDLDAERLRRILDDATIDLGIERALTEVILAGLREIGDRWEVGRCDIAHEHVAGGEVRSWIARRRSLLPAPGRDAVVMACAPDEQHTFGLDAFALLVGLRGWRCVVLGAATPAASLREAVMQIRPRAAVVASHFTGSRRSGIESIRAVATVRGVEVFCGGAGFTAPAARRNVKAVWLGDDIVDAAVTLDARLRRRG